MRMPLRVTKWAEIVFRLPALRAGRQIARADVTVNCEPTPTSLFKLDGAAEQLRQLF